MRQNTGSNGGLEARVDNLERAVGNISQKLDLMIDKLGQQQRPQYGLIISLASFLTLILGAWGTALVLPVKNDAIHLQEQLNSFERIYERNHIELDNKLQKEFSLSLEGTKNGLTAVNESSRERHDDAIKQIEHMNSRVERIENWQDDQAKADLQELRQRRMKDFIDHYPQMPTKP